MLHKRGFRILAMLLALTMMLGNLPVSAVQVELTETELNKLVGYYASTADPERQGAVVSAAQIANQTQSVVLDQAQGMLSLDFGTAAYVTRVELVSTAATTDLTGDDFEVWLGTENFGRVYFPGDGTNERRAQLGKMSKQDYTVTTEIRDGRAVLQFRFRDHAAGRYLVIQMKNPRPSPTFVLEQMGRDVHAYGELGAANDPAVIANELTIRPDTVAGDDGTASLPKLGEGTYTAFDRKDASLTLDMGKMMAVSGITLRAADAAQAIPTDAVVVLVSDDGENYRIASDTSMTQAVVDGRRELHFLVDEAAELLQGRYFKLCYTVEGAEAFEILNTEQDIRVSYDPFGLPGSDSERRESYSIGVSAAYFDGRLKGEYGQEALDKRNEMSVEEFIPWYLDNLNSNFNYLYRWENIGEPCAADNANISMALKMPAKAPVDQITVTATGVSNVRLLPEDWIVSWSNDDRNFTVIDHDTMTFRESIQNGKRVHIIDFPEVEAKTFLVYNTYTKNFTELPSGKEWFVVTTNQASYAAYNKLDKDVRYTAAPVAVEGRTGDTLKVSGQKTQLLLELEEAADVASVTLTARSEKALNAASYKLQVWNAETGAWVEPTWSARQSGTDHVFTLEDANTRYILLSYTDITTADDYFAQTYSGYSVSVGKAGDPVSLADGLSKAGFAYSSSYITGSNGLSAVELWALITAEPDPVSAYRVARKNGLSIGWTYRITESYALDTSKLRQSVMYYWSAAKTFNRLTVASNKTYTDIRVTTDDFYVAYSTDNFTTYTLLEPKDLTVTAYTTDGGCPAFSIDLPEAVQASHVIIYTTYSLGTLSNPDTQGKRYYTILPGDANNCAFYVPTTKTVTPNATTLGTGVDPMAASKTDVLLDLGEAKAVTHVNLTPAGETVFTAEDYEVLIHDGDAWKAVKWTAADGVIVLAEDTSTRYILLRYKGGYNGADYFAENFSSITATLAPEGESISLNDGLAGRTFAPGSGYLPSSIDQETVWNLIHAETDPVNGYKVALKNGVSIGWAYRITDRTAVDHHSVRQSIMLYWGEEKTLNRIYIPTDSTATNLRVGTDDFYVAYSSDNFTTYETFTPDDLTVTQGATADDYPCFTIDLPEITARYIIVYTTYNLETLSNPSDTGHAYFIVIPTEVQVFKEPVAQQVVPEMTALESGKNPFAEEEKTVEEGKEFALDRKGRAVGFQNLESAPVARIMMLGTGSISIDKADYTLYTSNDNASWTGISDFSLSTASVAGKTALCVDTNVDAAFVKLVYVGKSVGGFTVTDLEQDLYAFSLESVRDYGHLYQKTASIGFAEGDRAPAVGIANSFGSSESFTFDMNYRSLVADLGESTTVNFIRLYDDDGQTRLVKQDLSIYVSEDNVTYTKVDDFDFRQEGVTLHLYNFSAKGRYIKIHQNHYETSDGFKDADGKPTGEPLTGYATFKGSLQEVMAVYNMPVFSIYADENAYPYGQGQWKYYKELTLDGEGDLVLLTYEQLGLDALVAAGKLRADYADIRFTTTDGLLLHCYDNGNGFYIRAKDNEQILMFYGEPNASSVCDGAGTFQVDYGGKTFGPALGGDVHMAMLPDGRMIQIAHASLKDEDGEEVFLAISGDNGLTFGEPVQISNTPNHDAQAGGILVLEDGTVMITYMWAEKNGGYGGYLDPEKTNMPVYAVFSKDLEQWSEPVKVSADYTYNLATTNPMQAANGDIYLPIATIVDNHGSVGIYVMRSQDGGQTWEQASPLYQNNNAYFEGGYAEPCAVELDDGTIRVFFRQGAGLDITMLGQITSYDNGKTWTEVEQSQFYSTCTQPVTYKLDSGRILLMWAGHNGTSAKTYQRMPVTVVYSDDNGKTWHGYQEVSGRTLINVPFGHPMALQPDFCYAPDGSLTWMIWVRGSVYAPDGRWVSIRLEDFDRWMEENTGAYDDFEQASVVKNNYWYEMGPRVGVSEECSVSGERALRVQDASTIDTAMAVRNFMGTKKGELRVSLRYTSASSGLRLGLWECEPVHITNVGDMFQLDVGKDGQLSWVDSNGALNATGISLKPGQWYDLAVKFDVENGSADVLVDGVTVATIGYTAQQTIISYFAAFSTGVEATGTEFFLDDLIVIDSEDADLSATSVSGEYPMAEYAAQTEIAFYSISLEGKVSLNMYATLSKEALEDGYLSFTKMDGTEIRVPVADAERRHDAETGLVYYVFSILLPAKEMSDTVKVQLFSGGEAVTQIKEYSIASYAYKILEDTTGEYDEVKPLVEAMLNYGAAAQIYFGHNTENLANEGLKEKPDYSGITAQTLEPYASTSTGTEKASFCGNSLLLKGETSLRFFFEVANGATFTAAYGDKNLETTIRNGLHYVTLENIAAKDLDKAFTLTVSDGTASAEVTACALTYVYNALHAEPGTYPDELLNLVKALYAYNQAANAYFDNSN